LDNFSEVGLERPDIRRLADREAKQFDSAKTHSRKRLSALVESLFSIIILMNSITFE